MFIGGVACWPFRECFVLEAIAAERMPQRMVVWGVPRAAVYELRDYGASGAEVVEGLGRRGIRGVLWDDGRVLFGFESLAERERAWREAGSDPDWAAREIAVYKTISRRDAEGAEKKISHG
jgi:hypothetical protein